MFQNVTNNLLLKARLGVWIGLRTHDPVLPEDGCIQFGREENKLFQSYLPVFLKYQPLSSGGRRMNTGFEAAQNWFPIGPSQSFTSNVTLWKLPNLPEPWFIYKMALTIHASYGCHGI